MPGAIRQLQAKAPLDISDIREFIESHEFPILEGNTATFVYHGAVDRVMLQHWIQGLTTSEEFQRIPETDLWFLRVELPPGARVEYKLKVRKGRGTRLVRDPLNESVARDPFGANSVCYGAGYVFPEWALEDSDSRPGEIEDHVLQSAALGEEKHLKVYVPPLMRRTRSYPLLIVHDGHDYLKFASLKEVLDNLIYRHEIAPMVVAMTQSERRLVRYGADPAHADYIVDELLPYLVERYPISDEPAHRGLMGASFGAVASLSTAWRRPDVFGRMLLQSGSFAFTDIGKNDRGPVYEPVVEFMNAFRDQPGKPSERVYISCGMYEGPIYLNRSLVPLLQGTGMELRYTEARDGHNWENWRDRLREGLSFLFPGPLWMVYE